MPATVASFSRAPGLNVALAGVEQHVRHIDDQAARRLARFEDDVQLTLEPVAQVSLFCLGPRDGLACIFSARL